MNSARMLGFGVWRSLVARLVRDEKVEGSNPFTPTKNNTKTAAYGSCFLLSGCLWLRLCRFCRVVFGGGLFVRAYAKPKK